MQGFRIRAGRLFLHYCSELGPTEFLQGREPVEVGFDGRLVGGWQVWQALEGAWERQVVGLRLRGQDATYPIVFWRHIHTYTDTEEGKRGGNGQADVSYANPPKKETPGNNHRKTTCCEEKRVSWQTGWSFSCTNICWRQRSFEIISKLISSV